MTSANAIREHGWQAAAAIAVAALALLAAAAVSDDSEASVSNLAVNIYDQGDTDYGGLAYMSDELPTGLDATQWVHQSNGYWYCVNSASGGLYGKILTYSQVGDIGVDQIRSDIYARLGLDPGSDFTFMQVLFTSECDSTVAVTVTKDGQTVYGGQDKNIDMSQIGLSLSPGLQGIRLLTMGTDTESVKYDISADDLAGNYQVSIDSNGSHDEDTATIGGAAYSVSGTFADADGNGIAGLTVGYTVTAGETGTGLVVTGASGEYTITGVPSEANVQFTYTDPDAKTITAGGYTFESVAQPGTVIGDVSGLVSKAVESTVTVTVSDADGEPARNVTLGARWVQQSPNADSPDKFDQSAVEGGLAFASGFSSTDSDGTARIAYTMPDAADDVQIYMLIWAETAGNGYSFDDGGAAAFVAKLPLSAADKPLTDMFTGHAGAFLWKTGDGNAVALTSEDRSLTVTVSAKNTSAESEKPIRDVELEAKWYYQTDLGDGTYRIVSEKASVDNAVEPGTASVISPTGTDGKAVVIYTLPADLDKAASPTKAYLYIGWLGFTENTPRSIFHFDAAGDMTAAASPDDVPALVSGKAGCVAYDSASMPAHDAAVSVLSDDNAYRCDATLSGDIPDGGAVAVVMYNGYDGNRGDNFTVTKEDNTFVFYVKEGTSATISWNLQGYEFTHNGLETPTATEDFEYASEISAVPNDFPRGPTTVLKTYTLNGASGKLVNVSYEVGNDQYRAAYVCGGDSLSVEVHGWSTDKVSDFAFDVTGMYVAPLGGGTATTAYEIEEVKYVVYASLGNKPNESNLVTDRTVIAELNGTQYKIAPGADGVDTVSLPIKASGLKYYVDDKKFDVTTYVREITYAPYNGYYGINLYNVTDHPAEVSFSVKYVGISSMENVLAPTVTDLIEQADITANVGDTVQLSAPGLSGFEFSGWVCDGNVLTHDAEWALQVKDTTNGKIYVATYSAESVSEDTGLDPTAIIIGLIGIAVAVLALAYVLIQNRRY